MQKNFDFKTQEYLIYKKWQDLNIFEPYKCDELKNKNSIKILNKNYSILMPPPNANAPLHCGHATYAIQDLMARYKRMQGYTVSYFSGTDHAGFETQFVYEKHLKKQKKSRFDFDRKTLFNDILEFVKQNSTIAIDQLKKVGIGADWSNNTFMLDDNVIDTVHDTFKKLHDDNLIYRDDYMVNYSVYHGTTFSNLETDHITQITNLYYVDYKIKDTDQVITVATTRPETIPADTAIAVNPEDTRYKDLVSKYAINPLTNQEIIIIQDKYVEKDFGTGALKITPAHDFNDYEIGKRHNLKTISIIDLYGKMTRDAGKDLEGLFVTKARTRAVELLKEKNALNKIDDKYENSLLVDYKDKKPIEPMLIANWFIKMDSLAKDAIKHVEEDKIEFNQETWKNQLINWLSNIRDWPISRQTVFGINIPIWYNINENELFVVFIDDNNNSHEGKLKELLKDFSINQINDGLQKVIAPKNAKYVISKTKPSNEYLPETDTFDTWFSSGQWPLTTTKYPNSKYFNDFYPTSFLDTMHDILFFWVSRMIMLSLYLTKDMPKDKRVPFKRVYIHGTITDEKGRKMSKSKGNVINPLELINKYGADALRMGIIVGGNTSAKMTSLSEDKVKGYRNFGNKLWNMARFINLMQEEHLNNTSSDFLFLNNVSKDLLQDEDKNILNELDKLIVDTTKQLDENDFHNIGEEIYQFIWHKIADEYIEHVKTRQDKDVALAVLDRVFKDSLKLIHPFMPFVTEAIWSELIKENNQKGPICIQPWPKTMT